MLTLLTLAAAHAACPADAGVSPFDAGVSPFDPADLAPGIILWFMPVDAAIADRDGLVTRPARWASELDYVGATAATRGDASPSTDAMFLEDLEAGDLNDIGGIPVHLLRAQDVVTPRHELVGANPTPHPSPVPLLTAVAGRSGWTVDEDGSTLVGIAPQTWSVDGIEVDGVAVLTDGNTVLGILGLPIVEDSRGNEEHLCETHLIIDPQF